MYASDKFTNWSTVMEKCNYDPVRTDDAENDSEENVNWSWRPLIRQLYVCSGAWSIYMALGLCFGAPTIFIHQIRKEANSTDAISEEMASWFGSVHGYSALPWIFIIPVFSQTVGRRLPFMIICINTLSAYILYYFSSSPVHLLISEIMQGMLLASNMTLLVTINTEYASPKYRGVFLSLHSSMFHIGVWIANATGIFSKWRNIGIVAFILCGYSATSLTWPESPYWLAIKGRFQDCATSHRWLKGTDSDSERELELLIRTQKDYIKSDNQHRIISYQGRIAYIRKTITTKAFYKPLLLCMSMLSLYHFSGKLVVSMYSLQIVNRIIKSESKAYVGVLILEGLTILGMQCGCVLTKFLRRRIMVLVTSAIAIMLLFIMSLYLYLISLDMIVENEYVTILLLTMYSVAISCGPMIITSPVFGELTPLRYKTTCLFTVTIFAESLMATILKVSPYIFRTVHLHGAFLFYGMSASVFTFILYKYLPETKDKTLQEIENNFKD